MLGINSQTSECKKLKSPSSPRQVFVVLLCECHQSLCQIPLSAGSTDTGLVKIADQRSREQFAHCLVPPKAHLTNLLSDTLNHLECGGEYGRPLRFIEFTALAAFLQHQPDKRYLHIG